MSGQSPPFRLNFEEALRFIGRDPRWLPKLALGALFSFLSIFIVGGILTQGYLLLLAGRVARAESPPLPEWEDWGEIMRQGFGGFLVSLALSVPLLVLGLLLMALYFPLVVLGASGGQPSGGGVAIVVVLVVIFSFLLIPLSLLVSVFGPAAHAQLVLHGGDLAAAFRFRAGFRFIGRHRGQYALMVVLSMAALSVLGQIGYFACLIGIFPAIFLAQLFRYHLIGQLCWSDRTVLNASARGD